MWNFSCPDWEDRLVKKQSLIPDLPLIASEADLGLAIFDELMLPDVPGTPKMQTACGDWFREIVRTVFGSWDPEARVRHIRDFFAMLPKGQSKTTYSAGLLVAGMLMNKRPNAEALFVAPTQAISDNAYEKAVGMIELSPDLSRRFRPRDHVKTIEDLKNGSSLRVKTFDTNVLTGAILIMAMVDELHLLGKSAHTTKVLRQIRGGLEKTDEGFLLITTTQSDEAPAGAFKDELRYARRIRDGKSEGRMLPILYEFPIEVAKTPELWQDPRHWDLVMPNLGRSVKLPSLIADWNSEREKGEHAVKVWASQHLNIEIGVGISDDGWVAAEFWEAAVDETLTLDEVLRRSEVATIGIDGGGMDDLLGICVIGREREKVMLGEFETQRSLVWCHAICDPKALEERKDIASRLLDFDKEGDLSICEGNAAYVKLGEIVKKVKDSGLLPEKNAVCIDPNKIGRIVDALKAVGIKCGEDQQLWRQRQGLGLETPVHSIPFQLSEGSMVHGGSGLMSWCIGNAKVIQRGNGVFVTKQAAGRAKIDPVIALLEAHILMDKKPEAPAPREYQMFFVGG